MVYSKPLCPDACSGFIIHDPDARAHNKEIKVATCYLIDVILPQTAKELSIAIHEDLAGLHRVVSLDSIINLPECLHRNGVNLRYIGLIFNLIQDRTLKMVLLIEAIARILKNDLRRRLRRKMAHLQLPFEAPYRALVVQFLNRVFYHTVLGSPASLRYWKSFIAKQGLNKFHLTSFNVDSEGEPVLTDPYTSESMAQEDDNVNEMKLRGQTTPPHSLLKKHLTGSDSPTFLELLMKRFICLSGLQLSEHAQGACRGAEAFHLLDCPAMEIKVKQMSIVTNAQGHALFNRASLSTDPVSALALFTEAVKVYDLALQHSPNDWEILLNAAECWTKIYLYKASGGKVMTSIKLNTTHPLVHHIEHYYFRAMNADRDNPFIHHKYARFLMLCTPSRLERAQDEFLHALELDPSSTEYLMSYATFLRNEMQESAAADRFEARLYRAMLVQRDEEETLNSLSCKDNRSFVVPHEVTAKVTEFLSRQGGSASLHEIVNRSLTSKNDDHALAINASASSVWLVRDLLIGISLIDGVVEHCPREVFLKARDITALCARDSITPFEAYVGAHDPRALTLAIDIMQLVTVLNGVCSEYLKS